MEQDLVDGADAGVDDRLERREGKHVLISRGRVGEDCITTDCTSIFAALSRRHRFHLQGDIYLQQTLTSTSLFMSYLTLLLQGSSVIGVIIPFFLCFHETCNVSHKLHKNKIRMIHLNRRPGSSVHD